MTTATFHHVDETFIGTYRRPAGCAARRHSSTVGEPNFLARRLAAGVGVLLVAATSVMALDGLLASLGGEPAVAAETQPARAVSGGRHVARSGDTMWSIAATYRGDVDHDRYVDALIRLNGGTRIEVGQAVVLP